MKGCGECPARTPAGRGELNGWPEGSFAHPGPDLLLLIEGQGQREAQGLGDTLDGEGLESVTCGEQFPFNGTDRDPQPVGRHLGQGGNVIGHLPCPSSGRTSSRMPASNSDDNTIGYSMT